MLDKSATLDLEIVAIWAKVKISSSDLASTSLTSNDAMKKVSTLSSVAVFGIFVTILRIGGAFVDKDKDSCSPLDGGFVSRFKRSLADHN